MKSLKSKTSWTAHEQTEKHKKNEQEADLKTLFKVNFTSLIYKYNEFKEITSVYKEFVQNYNLTLKKAGFRTLEDVDLEGSVLVKRVGDVMYVKGYENYYVTKPPFKIECKFNGIFLK